MNEQLKHRLQMIGMGIAGLFIGYESSMVEEFFQHDDTFIAGVENASARSLGRMAASYVEDTAVPALADAVLRDYFPSAEHILFPELYKSCLQLGIYNQSWPESCWDPVQQLLIQMLQEELDVPQDFQNQNSPLPPSERP
ncbi:MAG TPA: hypothetical protein VJC21_04205 [Candidatus Nanoarchaeia archaeon]|nr:hypothetical protein [Candidatus Nanoarchaeia archaeon]